MSQKDIRLPGGGGPRDEKPEWSLETVVAVEESAAETNEVESESPSKKETEPSEELSSRGESEGSPKRESSSEAEETSQSSGPRWPVINCGGGSAGGRTTLREVKAAE